MCLSVPKPRQKDSSPMRAPKCCPSRCGRTLLWPMVCSMPAARTNWSAWIWARQSHEPHSEWRENEQNLQNGEGWTAFVQAAVLKCRHEKTSKTGLWDKPRCRRFVPVDHDGVPFRTAWYRLISLEGEIIFKFARQPEEFKSVLDFDSRPRSLGKRILSCLISRHRLDLL